MNATEKQTSEGIPMRRIALASMIGSLLEWYDFFLYGFAAALVFGPLFFPAFSSTAGTLAALATFSVGFVARPLGGVLCGHFGDRIGRRAMLIATITLMGTASTLIGLLPTYESIGLAAPILLVVLRFAQGVGLGGEWGGAVLMVVEHSPRAQRGFWGGIIQLGAPLGQALATGLLFGGSYLLSDEAFLSWGWRIPFLLSSILLLVGLFIRLNIVESPEFKKLRDQREEARFPILEVLRSHRKALLLCFALYVGALTVPFFINGVFMTSYAAGALGLTRSEVLLAVGLTHATVFCLMTVIGGAAADRIAHRPLYLSGAIALAVLAFPTFWIVNQGSVAALLIGIIIFGAPMWFCWGMTPVYFSEVFPARVRYSGISLSGQAATVIGGLVPLVATAAVSAAAGATWPVALIGVVGASAAALALWAIGSEGTSRSIARYRDFDVRTDPEPAVRSAH